MAHHHHHQHRPGHLPARRGETGLGHRDANRLWVGDITYLRTWQGWRYLATALDAHSRRVIGWATTKNTIAGHMRTDLVEPAWPMAITLRGELPAGIIFHADRSTHYASAQITALAAANSITLSMGLTGICWDNAMAESLFATLKTEFYYRRTWPTQARARLEVGAWIEDRSNRRRRHSALGQISPVKSEKTHAPDMFRHSSHVPVKPGADHGVRWRGW